jgi:hypothetical protein
MKLKAPALNLIEITENPFLPSTTGIGVQMPFTVRILLSCGQASRSHVVKHLLPTSALPETSFLFLSILQTKVS